MTNLANRATLTYLASFVFVAGIGALAIVLVDNPNSQRILLNHAAFDGILPQEPLTLYTTEWNIYQTIFKEPFETAVFLFRDGTVLTYSTREESRVGVPPSIIVENITRAGRRLEDCLRIVHNHFRPGGFTPSDKTTYNYLKGLGFKGIFGIYYTSTGLFESIE